MEDWLARIDRLEHDWRTLHEKCRHFYFMTEQSLPLLRQTDYLTPKEIAARMRHFSSKPREDFDTVLEELVSNNILNFFGVKQNSDKIERLYHPFVIVLESAVEHDRTQLQWIKSAILSNLLAILEPAFWPEVTTVTRYDTEALNVISVRDTGKELDLKYILELGLESPAHLAIESERKRYRNSIVKLVKELGVNLVKSLHRYLDHRAHQIDRNAALYLLVRSLPENVQSSLVSAFGLSVYYRKLAEMVRRAYEEAFSECLDEEGSRFSNQSSAVLVRDLGTDRPITNIDRARPNVARFYKISDKIAIRCYVEGQTEKAFMDTILGASKKELGVEIVNLKGKLTTKKGISLRDMLEDDLESERYSYLLCDNDRGDVIRELKLLGSSELIIGQIFLSDPDFESSLPRQCIVSALSEQVRKEIEELESLVGSQIFEGMSGRAIESIARREFCIRSLKGKSWGQSLATAYAGLEESVRCRFRFESYLASIWRTKHSNYNVVKQISYFNESTMEIEYRRPVRL